MSSASFVFIDEYDAFYHFELSQSLVELLKTLTETHILCSNILHDNSDSRVLSVSAYQQILNSLALLLDKGNLSAEQQEEITDQMILIADRIAAKDTENKQFLTELFKYGSCILGGALLLGAAILGVNVKGTRIPSLKRA